jgi:anthranilate synthase component I, non-proteobacterial lineages
MIFPSLDLLKTLAATGNVLPVCSRILADTETPVTVWMKLFSDTPCSFLLESVTGGDKVARYSFIGGNPFLTFRSKGLSWEISGKYTEKGSSNPLQKLREILARYRSVKVDDLPPLCGGAVGYFSYDAIRLCENIPDKNPKDTLLADDVFFGFYSDIVAFDNREHKLLLITTIFTEENPSLETAYKEARFRLGSLEDKLAVRLPSSMLSIRKAGDITSNFRREQYEAAVDSCKEYIKAGDIFQVVLSQRFTVEVEARPFDLYRILRTINPSPYMFFLSVGGAHIIGASPEMLVRVENRMVEIRPIAGTRGRGKNDEEDLRIEQELKNDPKELAEHIMLVDLGRNDVGRVCEYGSVKVEDMMHIEKYSHVMHMVSNISGKLKEPLDALDALFSGFPAGTLSGAPKIRAMEIIDELENVRRGIYGGTLGYIDFGGNLDSCIVIRTLLFKDNVAYIQAGAGIVADSVPSREYDETVSKAKALTTAIHDAGAIIGRE